MSPLNSSSRPSVAHSVRSTSDVVEPTILESAWRYRTLVILCALVGLVVAGGLSFLLAPKPTVTTTIGLSAADGRNLLTPGLQGEGSLSRYAAGRALFVTSDEVLGLVAAGTGISLADVRTSVSAAPALDSLAVAVTVTASDRPTALRIADQVVTSYGSATDAQLRTLTNAALNSIQNSQAELITILSKNPSPPVASAASSTLAQLQKQASDLKIDEAVFGDGISYVERPSANESGSRRPLIIACLVGALLGLAIGTVWAWFRAARRPRVSDPSRAAEVFGAPVVVTLTARNADHLADLAKKSPEQTVAALYPAVFPLVPQLSSGVVLMCAPVRDALPTQLALSLAVAARAEGRRVLLVDAAHTQSLTRSAGISEDRPGFSSALRKPGGDGGVPFVTTIEVGGGQLSVLSGEGGRDPQSAAVRRTSNANGAAAEGTTVTAHSINDLISRAREAYDLVLICSEVPGMDPAASTIAGLADHVIVVLRRATPLADVDALASVLDVVAARVSGVVSVHSGVRHS